MGAWDLTGRAALVSGASRGIGRHIAIALAQAGADIALVARDTDKLEQVSAPELLHPYHFTLPAMRRMMSGGTRVAAEPPWFRPRG